MFVRCFAYGSAFSRHLEVMSQSRSMGSLMISCRCFATYPRGVAPNVSSIKGRNASKQQPQLMYRKAGLVAQSAEVLSMYAELLADTVLSRLP